MKSIIPAKVINTETKETQDTLIVLNKSEKPPKLKRDKEIVSMIRANPGISISLLAERFKVDYNAMDNILTSIETNGLLFGELNGCVEIIKENGRYKDE